MTDRRKKRRKHSALREAADLIKAAALLVIAVILVIFVFLYIKNSTFLFHEKPVEESKETELPTEEETTLPERDGFYEAEGKVSYYRGGEALKDTWLSLSDSLFYFDKDAFMLTGKQSMGAFLYDFGKDGILKSVYYDLTYLDPAENEASGYPGVVRSKTVWAYLDQSRSTEHFQAVLYKRTTDSMSHLLGGSENPQYAVPGSVSIGTDGYIYYLPITDDPDTLEEMWNRKLFRMKPGDAYAQLVCEDVEGYVLCPDEDGSMKIYCESNGRLDRVQEASIREAQTKRVYPETETFTYDISEDSLSVYLCSSDGRTVYGYPGEFEAAGFHYTLNGEGEILDADVNRSVTVSGLTYRFEADESEDHKISRLVRDSGDDTTDVISSEFRGSAANLHTGPDGCLYAEYANNSESGILRITKDGDIDLLSEKAEQDLKYRLFGLTVDRVLVMEAGGETRKFRFLNANDSVPVAVAVDPVDVDDLPEISDVPAAPSNEGAVLRDTPPETRSAGPGGAAVPEASISAVPQGESGDSIAIYDAPGSVQIGGTP